MLKKVTPNLLVALGLIVSQAALASSLTVPVNFTAQQGVGKPAGTVLIEETPYGLLFTPNLKGLTPGIHGFHIHQNPSCDKDGEAAGGHLDPKKTNKHLGPYNNHGHLGDLPALYITQDGTATLPVLTPRLKHLKEIKQHALMVHEGGDN